MSRENLESYRLDNEQCAKFLGEEKVKRVWKPQKLNVAKLGFNGLK